MHSLTTYFVFFPISSLWTILFFINQSKIHFFESIDNLRGCIMLTSIHSAKQNSILFLFLWSIIFWFDWNSIITLWIYKRTPKSFYDKSKRNRDKRILHLKQIQICLFFNSNIFKQFLCSQIIVNTQFHSLKLIKEFRAVISGKNNSYELVISYYILQWIKNIFWK